MAVYVNENGMERVVIDPQSDDQLMMEVAKKECPEAIVRKASDNEVMRLVVR